MIIVRQWAGLGNQMFIYAYYRAMQEKGYEVKLDKSYYNDLKAYGGSNYKIPELFGNSVNVFASAAECAKLANYKMDKLHRITRKLGFDKKTHIVQTKKYRGCGYNPELLEIDNVYIDGYFQSERYFKEIESKIRKEFEFTSIPKAYPNDYREQIISSNAISLHIRRGDYVSGSGNSNKILCAGKYYENAISYMNSKVEDATYYVFSDDIVWCKEFFATRPEKIIFVEGQAGAYLDMYLMTLCKHNIIADSTFSWWGAWLNTNENKIVCAPDQWLPDSKFDYNSIVPDEWIKISRK